MNKPDSITDDQWSTHEERAARLVGLLLANAKFVQQSSRFTRSGDAMASAKSLAELGCIAVQLWPDGRDLEREVLTLAEALGFKVEQHFSQASTVMH